MTSDELPPVVDNDQARQFELAVDGALAFLTYRVVGPRLVLIHTEVPDALEGRGVGADLVRAAVARAEADALTLVPKCPFVRAWLERHPGEADRVTIDWG